MHLVEGDIINAVLSYDVLGIIINRMIKRLMFFIAVINMFNINFACSALCNFHAP